MEWSETGVVISTRPHGETSAIAELFTRTHGRHLGLVRGGRSRRMRPMLQIGNSLNAIWRARLEDHLGTFTLEADIYRAAHMIDDALKLEALTSLTVLAGLLPERHPYSPLYDAFIVVLDALDQDGIWPALAVRWELGLLQALGFGLDLSECVSTKTDKNLIYVSPKSGRAVSAEAGEPYRDKLLKLPQFLVNGNGAGDTSTPDKADVLNGFKLTGFFFNKYVFEPRGRDMPDARGRMIAQLSKKT